MIPCSVLCLPEDVLFWWDLSLGMWNLSCVLITLREVVVVLVLVLRRCAGEFLLSVLFNAAFCWFLFSPETNVRGYHPIVLVVSLFPNLSSHWGGNKKLQVDFHYKPFGKDTKDLISFFSPTLFLCNFWTIHFFISGFSHVKDKGGKAWVPFHLEPG